MPASLDIPGQGGTLSDIPLELDFFYRKRFPSIVAELGTKTLLGRQSI
jgi:hypothetical protein